MKNNNIISGTQPLDCSSSDPLYALTEFYRAFNSSDIDLMTHNWEQSNDATMSNPLGGLKRGWPELLEGYQRIFNSDTKVYIELYDYSIDISEAMFLLVGYERGYFRKGNEKVDLNIRTTRVYRKQVDGWKQLHQHGSIDDADQLKNYQTLVRKKLKT